MATQSLSELNQKSCRGSSPLTLVSSPSSGCGVDPFCAWRALTIVSRLVLNPRSCQKKQFWTQPRKSPCDSESLTKMTTKDDFEVSWHPGSVMAGQPLYHGDTHRNLGSAASICSCNSRTLLEQCGSDEVLPHFCIINQHLLLKHPRFRMASFQTHTVVKSSLQEMRTNSDADKPVFSLTCPRLTQRQAFNTRLVFITRATMAVCTSLISDDGLDFFLKEPWSVLCCNTLNTFQSSSTKSSYCLMSHGVVAAPYNQAINVKNLRHSESAQTIVWTVVTHSGSLYEFLRRLAS